MGGDIYSAEGLNAFFPNGGTAMTCPAILESRLVMEVRTFERGSVVVRHSLGFPDWRA